MVQAHPAENSFNRAIFDEVLAALKQRQRAVATVHISAGDELTSNELGSIEHLIAIYPTWYGSLPAVFLEAMAKLVGPWVDGDEPVETSPLHQVQKLKVICTHGSSKLVNVLQGEPGMQLWKRTVLPLCAPGAAFGWKALYKLDRNDNATRATFLAEAVQFAAS